MIKRFLSLAIIIAACCFPVFSAAQESERIMVNQLLGDGSHGKVWRQWQHQAPEREVASVTAMLQKRSGGKDTFVNLRFGVDGAAFENGKQVFLPNNKPSTVTWNVSQRPSGKPFVLNVYKGEAFLSTVIVRYAQSAAALPPPSKPHAPGVRIGNVPPPAPDGRFTGTSSNRPRNYPDSRDAAHACRTMRNIRPPRIELGRIRPAGGFLSGQYKVEGSMYGSCIEEAGYFEFGRLKKQITFPYTEAYQRREFEIKAKSGQRGELRIYSTSGREDIIDLDRAMSHNPSPWP